MFHYGEQQRGNTLSSAATASWVADLTSSPLTDSIWSPCISRPSVSTKPPFTISDTNTPVSFLIGKVGRQRHVSGQRSSLLADLNRSPDYVFQHVIVDTLFIQQLFTFQMSGSHLLRNQLQTPRTMGHLTAEYPSSLTIVWFWSYILCNLWKHNLQEETYLKPFFLLFKSLLWILHIWGANLHVDKD